MSEKHTADFETLITADALITRESLNTFYTQHNAEKQALKESKKDAIRALRSAKKLKVFYEKKESCTS